MKENEIKDVDFIKLQAVGTSDKKDGCGGCIFIDIYEKSHGSFCLGHEVMVMLSGINCVEDQCVFKKKKVWAKLTKENAFVGANVRSVAKCDNIPFYTGTIAYIYKRNNPSDAIIDGENGEIQILFSTFEIEE